MPKWIMDRRQSSTRDENFNWFLFSVVAKKRANWQLIADDMHEDTGYLKQIVETGVYPERSAQS